MPNMISYIHACSCVRVCCVLLLVKKNVMRFKVSEQTHAGNCFLVRGIFFNDNFFFITNDAQNRYANTDGKVDSPHMNIILPELDIKSYIIEHQS